MSEAHYTVHTDGACSGNPGPGGWAFEARSNADPAIIQRSGSDPDTTNQRMEVTAALQALTFFTDDTPANITIVTDSEYVQKGSTEWLANWKAKGWRTSSKKPVANLNLWQQIDAVLVRRKLRGLTQEFKWVKGHANDDHNNSVDQLAVMASHRARAMR